MKMKAGEWQKAFSGRFGQRPGLSGGDSIILLLFVHFPQKNNGLIGTVYRIAFSC